MPTIMMTTVIMIAKRNYAWRIAIIAWCWAVISHWLAVIHRLAIINGRWVIGYRWRITIATHVNTQTK
jgi:hypothetical protein